MNVNRRSLFRAGAAALVGSALPPLAGIPGTSGPVQASQRLGIPAEGLYAEGQALLIRRGLDWAGARLSALLLRPTYGERFDPLHRLPDVEREEIRCGGYHRRKLTNVGLAVREGRLWMDADDIRFPSVGCGDVVSACAVLISGPEEEAVPLGYYSLPFCLATQGGDIIMQFADGLIHFSG